MNKLILLSLLMTLGHAQMVYKSELNGVTTYSERPSTGGNVVKLPDITIVPSKPKENNNIVSNNINIPVPSGMMLPPPPPIVNLSNSSNDFSKLGLDESIKLLDKMRKELEEQEDVRLGDEKNYQKKLDRLKPFQENINNLMRHINGMKSKN